MKVNVDHGWLTLTGDLDRSYQKQAAEASMFAALRDWPTTGPDTGTIAARLVTLPPHCAGFNVTSQAKALRAWAVTKSASFAHLIVALALGALFIISSRAVSTNSDKAPRMLQALSCRRSHNLWWAIEYNLGQHKSN